MMLLGYVDVNYAKILEFGESRFPPLGAPREQNAPLWGGAKVLGQFVQLMIVQLLLMRVQIFLTQNVPKPLV